MECVVGEKNLFLKIIMKGWVNTKLSPLLPLLTTTVEILAREIKRANAPKSKGRGNFISEESKIISEENKGA